MDTVAALTAPFLVDVDVASLPEFLGRTNLRVVHAHDDGRPFGFLLKGLLHGRLGTSLRCARLDLTAVDPDDAAARHVLGAWVDLAGRGGDFPPPAGYYLLRGRKLVGYHPPLDTAAADRAALARDFARGLLTLVSELEVRAAGKEALGARPELVLTRFFEEAAHGSEPRRAPAAGDRRQRQRRASARDGTPRRSDERAHAELNRAFSVLGLPPDAPLRAVKEVRNRLMRANHPDLLADHPERMAEATRFTVRLNEAYAVIRRAREAEARLR